MHDLHSHSLCSDGILRPQALVSRAKMQGVTVLALTDHDTVSGIGEARNAAAEEGIRLLPGIEFSCLWNGTGIHIVGLNIDPDHPAMVAAVEQQSNNREIRAEKIAAKLAKLGMPGTLEGAKAKADGGVLGRPHFAKFLIEAGHVKSMDQAFKKYLGSGKPGDVKQIWPSIEEAVGWIVAAGGVAVVAHPDKYKMTRTKLGRLLEEFVAVGGQAMEVVSGRQAPDVTRDMRLLANKYGLYASCGSDFHVPDQPWQELGNFDGLPEDCRPVWDLWS
ncbi:PHP domain-containing protein [Aestuariicella hydrocarbonica]|uniref:PHP domain-containing protein n=1 Tax=Pseudomaricurvus hydrocarbonicus TaxID=1470433 RepID=UPI001AA01974|nr:PHP domain-containing protein [Aestuariicella hydrocarbonica]